MEPCLCSTIHQLAQCFNECRASGLATVLNIHLGYLREILAQSKSLTQNVQYRITLNSHRSMKALFVESVDLAPTDQLCERFRDDIDGFWALSDDTVLAGLQRRLTCVIILLRSKLGVRELVTPQLSMLLPRNQNYADLKNSGRKYLKIAHKLGGLGTLFWLPLEIPHSTYERYLVMHDEEVFSHLSTFQPLVDRYADFVQRLIISQLQGLPPSCSYQNLFLGYSDIIPATEQLHLLLHALGGSGIPDLILQGLCKPQRRWGADGEVESTGANEYGLPVGLVGLMSDTARLSQAMISPCIAMSVQEDGIITRSLSPELGRFYTESLLPQTLEELKTVALRLICFSCPPCYEGNTDWPAPVKKVIWPLLETTAKEKRVQEPLRTQVVDAILYFCERDGVPIRRRAVQMARTFLRKSMPYYLHASVVLFESVLQRLDGEFIKSEAHIRQFFWQGLQPATRRDLALQGRLHISQIDNKLKCYDSDVSLFIYKWEAKQPPSTLEIEVMSRLQSAAARFFQSIGDFDQARGSLEQFLSLNSTNPIRINTRRLIVGRLADIYCEAQEYTKASEILQPELDGTAEAEHERRPYRRLLLSLLEAKIGMGQFHAAEQMLGLLKVATPPSIDDLYNQQLYMRGLLASARIAHLGADYEEAMLRWRYALQEIEKMHTLKALNGFTAAMIYISMAHAQMATGDINGSRNLWAAGVEILRTEKCEFWIPIVPTLWLNRIAADIHLQQGWQFHMLQSGKKPDIS